MAASEKRDTGMIDLAKVADLMQYLWDFADSVIYDCKVTEEQVKNTIAALREAAKEQQPLEKIE